MIKNFSKLGFQIGVGAFLAKTVGCFLFFYLFSNIESGDVFVQPQWLTALLYGASLFGFVGLVFCIVAFFKKQFNIQSVFGFILNILAILIFPFVYSV